MAALGMLLSACNDEGRSAWVQPPTQSSTAPSFTQVIAFGDSLSDGGTYNPTTADDNPANDTPSGLIFSTKPGMTWSGYVAASYGLTLTPNRQVNFGVVGNGGRIIELGGTNYAEGGARVEVDAPDGGVVMQTIPGIGPVPVQVATSRSIKSQIDAYLAEHGSFNDRQLVLIQGGANDLFAFLSQVAMSQADPATASTVVGTLATAMVTQVQRLREAGATHIIYSNLPDLGMTPQFRGTPLAGLATTISMGYNQAVDPALTSAGVNVFDTFTELREIAASPETYGFTNATSPACTSYTSPGDPSTLSSLICFATTVVEPGADLTYVFADGVHPTARAHAHWADRVTATIPNP